MKQKWKRLISGLLAVLTLLSAVTGNGITAFAASPQDNIAFWYAAVCDAGYITELNPTFYQEKVLYSIIDGNAAYCMNFGLDAHGGQLMSSSYEVRTALSDSQRKLLAYCMYYGFSATEKAEPTQEQCNEYIATQAMVWIIMADIFGTGSADLAAGKLCATAPDSSASYSYYLTLKENISNAYYMNIPSFAAKNMSSAPSYILKWNSANNRYEMTLTDTNNVLDQFGFAAAGFQTVKSGNSLTVYTNTVNETPTIVSASAAGKVDTPTGCVFWLTGNDRDQEFISTKPVADPINAYFKVYTESVGYGAVVKTDKSTGTKLSGAVFGIYSDSNCISLVDKITTNSSGYAKSGELTPGTYYMKEISAPKGYTVSSQIHTLTVTAGKTTEISATDTEQTGSITIYKEGEVLTDFNGTDFVYETKRLKGAEFKVTAGEDIYRADGTKVYGRGDMVKANLASDVNGQAVLTDLHLGTYVVTETKTIDGYTLNSTPVTVKLEYAGQNETVVSQAVTVSNVRQKAEVSVIKKDSDTDNVLVGGEYTLYAGEDIKNDSGKVIVNKGTALQTVTTGANGGAAYTISIPIKHSYYIKETKAPQGYIRSSEAYYFTFDYLSEDTARKSFCHTFENDRVKAKIHLYKVDSETKKAVPQGDASLEGAVYGLYARQDITHSDGMTGVLYKADELIGTLTTDSKGEAEIKDLYLGRYYVKEISPSEGYLLDEREYDIDCAYEGDKVSEIYREVIVTEQVIKQPFELIKVADDGKETENRLLEGAGFSVYLKSSLKMNSNGSYNFKDSVPVAVTNDEKTIMYTDNKGYACTIALPYGTYVAVETVTPHNMKTIEPFEVSITENSPETPQVWRVFTDREFSAKLRIVKKDTDTGYAVLVPNAGFQIYDLDKEEYVSIITTYPSKVVHTEFYTDEDGDLILPDTLKAGSYRIEETKAPYGYTVSDEKVYVDIDTDTFYEVDTDTNEAVITVEYEDEQVLGELTIIKKGEVLSEYAESDSEGSKNSDNKDFVYRTENLSGAKFNVYAAEDICTADYQKDSNGNRIRQYQAGELVVAVTTDKSGKAKITDLPLGTYKVVEVEAPHGYALNENEQIITFAYADDKTPVVYQTAVFHNERQKLALSVVKKDKETDKPVSGAVFSLYADEDIKNVSGRVIAAAGTMLESAVSDENGMAVFKKDYPFAKFYVKETKVPKGYVSAGKIITFDTKYQGQNIKTAEYTTEFLNTPTTFEFTKEDITSGAGLTGASLMVIDKNGNVIDAWTSKTGEKHVIKYLTAGETYTLREIMAPYGYLKAEDIQFTVEDTENIQSVVMKDEVPTGTIIINKDGEFLSGRELMKGSWQSFRFCYLKKGLSGVVFEVYASEDITSCDGLNTVYYHKNEHVGTIVTDDNGVGVMNGLPLGKYYLVEAHTAEGFVADRTPIEADVSYADQNTKVVYSTDSLTNERQKAEITVMKSDGETGEMLQGAVFGLFAAEDIYNSEGGLTVRSDEEIEAGVTDENGRLVFHSDLPSGKYYVKELAAPKGYAACDEIFEADVSYQGEDLAVIEYTAEFKNFPTVFEITKEDITGGEEIEGAKLTVTDEDGKVIDSWISTKSAHVIKYLEAGKTYILREETAPDGYVRAEDIEFTVEDTKEVQSVVMKDDYTKLEISKTDITGENEITGAVLTILDDSGNVIEKWTSGNEAHYIEKIPVGHYVLREETAPYGYQPANDIEFDVPETGELQKVTMKDEYVKGRIIIEKTDEVTGKPIAGVVFEIRDEDGNVVETIITDENGHAESLELAIALFNNGSYDRDIHYYVAEVKAAKGYEADDTVHEVVFRYEDEAVSEVKYTLAVTNKPQIPDTPKTGDTTNAGFLAGLLAMAVIAGIGSALLKKKNADEE